MSTTEQEQVAPAQVDDNGKAEMSYVEVRDIVLTWPVALRAYLIHEVLNSIVRAESPVRPEKKDTLSKAKGLAATGGPPPTDEEVDQMIEEAHMGKYANYGLESSA